MTCAYKNHEPCLLHYVMVSLNVAMHVKMVSNSKEFQSALHPIQLQEDKILHVKINKNVPVNTKKTNNNAENYIEISFIGYINNTMIKLLIYFNLHMHIDKQL